MDTLIGRKEFTFSGRTFEYLFTVSLFSFLVLSQVAFQSPIFAGDYIATSSIVPSTMQRLSENLIEETNIDIRKEKFENRIARKYRGLTVTNVADGIKHIKTVNYFNGKPVRINIVEINQKIATNYEVKPAIASYNLPHRKNLRKIATETNSIVAINGGFFKPQTGVPLGTLVIDKKLYTGPIYDRVALGIFDNGYDIGRVQLNAKITGNNHTIKIDNINQPRMLSSYTLGYTRDWGNYAPVSPQYGVQLQIVGNKITAVSANPCRT